MLMMVLEKMLWITFYVVIYLEVPARIILTHMVF